MYKNHLVKYLLSLSLIGIISGCGDHEAANVELTQKENNQTDEIKQKEATTSNNDSKQPKEQKLPYPDKKESNIWTFADTHSHPYEGTLESFELKNDQLISIKFKASTAIITPTNPTDIVTIGSKMGKTSTYRVRNDKEQSSKLTQQEIKHLKEGDEFLVVIDDWRDEQDESIQATEVNSIFYKKNGEYLSIKGNQLFDDCSNNDGNECKKITD